MSWYSKWLLLPFMLSTKILYAFLSLPFVPHSLSVSFLSFNCRYIAINTTTALDGDEWSASRPDRALPPVPIVQEAGWDPEPVWTQRLEEKSFAPDGNQTPIARSSSP